MEEFEEKELYLECLGHFIGLEFEPRSGLKLKERPTAEETDGDGTRTIKESKESKESEKDIVLPNLRLDLARTWKKGALTASLRRFGYDTENAPGTCEGQEPGGHSEFLERFRFRSKKSAEENLNDKQGRTDLKEKENGKQNQESKVNKVPSSWDSRKRTRNTCTDDDCSPPKKRWTANNTNQRFGLNKSDSVKLVSDDSGIFKPYVNPKNRTNGPDVQSSTEPKNSKPSRGVGLSRPTGSNISRSLFSSISSAPKYNNVANTLPVLVASAHGHPRTGISSTRVVEEKTPKEEEDPLKSGVFRTAYEQLRINDRAKGIKRNLGGDTRIPAASKPVDPPRGDLEVPKVSDNQEVNELMMNHECLKLFEPAIIERILGEVMEPPQETNWDDVAGLEGPKAIIKEIIIWPLLRPDIFTGLRAAPRGILLFGPPGTGKTMIARIKQPSVIFIDEIDSIMTQRSDTEHESSRRMKTEFLVQFDGCSTDSTDRVLVIGVTNRPQELDEAARRRLVKRIYIPLPDFEGRKQIVKRLMSDQSAEISEDDYNKIAEITEGYSGADMKNLCHVAANEPIRDISHRLEFIDITEVRPIHFDDFVSAKEESSKTVAANEMTMYERFDADFGCKLKLRKGLK